MVAMPKQKYIADAIVDAAAIVGTVTLAALGVVDGDTALVVVATVAGAWAAPRFRSGGPGEPPPPAASAGVVMGLCGAGADLARGMFRHVGAVLAALVLAALLAGCGGASPARSSACELTKVACELCRQSSEVWCSSHAHGADAGPAAPPTLDL